MKNADELEGTYRSAPLVPLEPLVKTPRMLLVDWRFRHRVGAILLGFFSIVGTAVLGALLVLSPASIHKMWVGTFLNGVFVSLAVLWHGYIGREYNRRLLALEETETRSVLRRRFGEEPDIGGFLDRGP